MPELATARRRRHGRRGAAGGSHREPAGDSDASLLRQLTEALVDGEPIQWAGVARAARTADGRHLSRQLQLVAAMAGTPLSATITGERRRGGRGALVIVAMAGVLVVSSLAVWLVTGAPTAYAGRAAVVASTAAAAAFVGAHACTRLTSATQVMAWLWAALLARPLVAHLESPTATTLLGSALTSVPVEAALPWALWAMVCATPHIERFGRLDRLCRSVMAAAVAWSGLLALATWLEVVFPGGVPVSLHPVWVWRLQATAGPGQLALLAWAAAAIVVVIVRVSCARRHADRQTRREGATNPRLRRGAVAVAILAVLAAWLAAHRLDLVSEVATSFTTLRVDAGPGMIIAALLPWGAVGLVWSAAAPRPALSLVASLRRHLATARLLAAVAALVTLVLRLASLRQRALTDIASDHVVVIAVVCGSGLLLLHAAFRHSGGAGLRGSGWRGAPEALIAELVVDLRHARTPREVASRVTAHVGAAVDGASVTLLFPGAAGWQTIVGPPITLAHDSALATMLIGAGDAPLRLGAGASLRSLLPRDDLAWLDRHAVHLLVPIAALDGPPRAALLLARSVDGCVPGRAAVALASVAAAATAMALERCAALAEVTTPDDVGYECPGCGRLDASPGPCRCGTTRCLSALPSMLDHRYRLERRLGRGGMGVVYAATDVTLGRRVALKTLLRAAAADAAALHVEAQAMAAITHPGVAVLYGLERWRGTPVLVMEYFERGTLAEVIARGPMPWRDAVAVGTALAHTLTDLHRRHWVHRDIKPANIAFDDDGRPVLLDFGLTRLLDGAALRAMPDLSAAAVEVTPPLAGTRAYLSPDALDGADVGPHDDVWALATVVCELLLGHRPWDDDTARPRDVRALLDAAGVPVAVADVLARALHPSNDGRMCRADELARQLGVTAGA